ncbi:MAG: hypothetical protein U9O83_04895, partial [Campylobacterota bacterium]|nr:hypothetical protein [Campylobacterota bacterium]
IKEKNPPKLRIRLEQSIRGIGCYLSSGEKMNVEWISKTEFEIVADAELKPRRDRYTCTAPAKGGKWYWYSHLWIIRE